MSAHVLKQLTLQDELFGDLLWRRTLHFTVYGLQLKLKIPHNAVRMYDSKRYIAQLPNFEVKQPCFSFTCRPCWACTRVLLQDDWALAVLVLQGPRTWIQVLGFPIAGLGLYSFLFHYRLALSTLFDEICHLRDQRSRFY